jgi:hypothetical protein
LLDLGVLHHLLHLLWIVHERLHIWHATSTTSHATWHTSTHSTSHATTHSSGVHTWHAAKSWLLSFFVSRLELSLSSILVEQRVRLKHK